MKRVATLLWIALAVAGCASTSRPPDLVSAGGVVYPVEAQGQESRGLRARRLRRFGRRQRDERTRGRVGSARAYSTKPRSPPCGAGAFIRRSATANPWCKELVSRVNFKLGESESYAR